MVTKVQRYHVLKLLPIVTVLEQQVLKDVKYHLFSKRYLEQYENFYLYSRIDIKIPQNKQ